MSTLYAIMDLLMLDAWREIPKPSIIIQEAHKINGPTIDKTGRPT